MTPRLQATKHLAFVLFASALSFGIARADGGVEFPAGYKEWRHIKSQIIDEGPGFKRFGGFHHIYANAPAVEGFKTGKFPDGAILVAEFLELEKKGNVVDGGKIRIIDVMKKDATKFGSTDGWGYAEFEGQSANDLKIDGKAECHGCHTSRRSADFVFSPAPIAARK